MSKVAFNIPSQSSNGESHIILIESSEGVDNLPSKASVTNIKQVAIDFQQQFEPVTAVAKSILESLRAAKPGKVTVEFGVELGGTVSIPLVTSGSSKANFKVTLEWADKK